MESAVITGEKSGGIKTKDQDLRSRLMDRETPVDTGRPVWRRILHGIKVYFVRRFESEWKNEMNGSDKHCRWWYWQ